MTGEVAPPGVPITVGGRGKEAGVRRNLSRGNWSRPVAVLVAWALTAGWAAAQPRHDEGLWLAVFGNGKFERGGDDSPLRWWFDGQARFLDDAGGFNQSLVRPGLGYAVAEDHTLWAGYAWVRTSPAAPADEFDEHRLWQQWTYTPKLDRYSFLFRSRLEERWVETGNDVGLRFRQMVRAQYRLTDTPQWSLVAWDEAFFHLNDTDWGARAGFDQNRAFVGVAFKADPDARTRVEVGYLNQYIYRRGGTDAMNHILSLNLFF